MPHAGVRLVRCAVVALVSACAFAPASTFAAAEPSAPGGGVALPAGAETTEPTVDATPAPIAVPDSGPVARPAPVMPALAAVSRRAGDPLVTDLLALSSPTAVVAADGHLLVTRVRGRQTELVDVSDPSALRILMSGTRAFGTPHAGTDAEGRAVVVISPCAGESAVQVGGQAPRCPLRAVDVHAGTSRALAGTTGALAGDIDGVTVTFTRGSTAEGVRLYTTEGGRARALALPLGAGEWASVRGSTSAVRGTLRLPSLDTAGGRLALVTDYRDGRGRAVSALWLRAGGTWARAEAVAAADTRQGAPRVLGAQLSASGAAAYVEGVVDQPSYLARWSDAGARLGKLSVRRSIGRATILAAAALVGDHMVFVDWLPGVPCGAADAPACGLRSVGPLSLDAR